MPKMPGRSLRKSLPASLHVQSQPLEFSLSVGLDSEFERLMVGGENNTFDNVFVIGHLTFRRFPRRASHPGTAAPLFFPTPFLRRTVMKISYTSNLSRGFRLQGKQNPFGAHPNPGEEYSFASQYPGYRVPAKEMVRPDLEL
jgi:hypothetical protein